VGHQRVDALIASPSARVQGRSRGSGNVPASIKNPEFIQNEIRTDDNEARLRRAIALIDEAL
jgi:hypothetical protein